MTLFELEQSDIEGALYNPAEDKINVRHTSDTRKPKLMLKHVNKLKKLRALDKLERLKREDQFSVMYGAPEDDGSGGMGMGGPPGF